MRLSHFLRALKALHQHHHHPVASVCPHCGGSLAHASTDVAEESAAEPSAVGSDPWAAAIAPPNLFEEIIEAPRRMSLPDARRVPC